MSTSNVVSTSSIGSRVPPLTALAPAIRLGVVGGVIVVLIALQGMVQAFNQRHVISDVVTMSQALLFISIFICAYLAVSRSGSRSMLAAATGALCGVVSSLLMVALLWIGSLVKLGEVFINATAELYELLTFGQGLASGSLYWLALGLGIGLAATFICLLPSNWRRATIQAFIGVVAFGLLQDLIRVTFSEWDLLAPVFKFLYLANGLTVGGAAALFLVIGGISLLRTTQGSRIRSGWTSLPATGQSTLRWAVIAAAVVILLLLPRLLGLYISEVLDNVGLYLLMGLGLNIVVGFAGLLDLGYVAFYAIGAYTVGVLTSPEFSTGVIHNWWLALPPAVACAVLAGVVLGIPVLKMRGDYLAIVTLGFGEIIRLLALSDFLKPYIGGAQGIQGIPSPNLGPLQINWTPQEFYYLFLGGCLLVAFVAIRMKNSRLGRAWMAVREDEDVAQAMGINLVATKLMAFGMGASFGGLSGAIFAAKLASAYPHSFNFLVSVNVLSLIIIGGMGSIPGVIIGALFLVGLPELLREVGDYRYLFYGAVLVTMMLMRPEGLWPEKVHRRELHEGLPESIPMPEVAAQEPGPVPAVQGQGSDRGA
ncbi:MAG: branched-chain amino acid ABC transporter permease [Chloroflexota bacterium]